MPILGLPIAEEGVLTWTLTDINGIDHDLTHDTNPTMFVAAGSTGLGSPPVEHILDKLPFTAGSILRRVSVMPMEFDIPILVRATTFSNLIYSISQLRGWVDPGNERVKQYCYLKIRSPVDGSVRKIKAVYSKGLEGNLKEGAPTWVLLIVTFIAPVPYWNDETDITETYGLAQLGGSTITHVNPGDFDAYPIWTINGPGSNIILQSITNSKNLELTANGGVVLTSGVSRVTVDTRPFEARDQILQIFDPDGLNMYDKLQPDSKLWWMTPGINRFTISITGATSSTTVGLRYTSQYRGVLR